MIRLHIDDLRLRWEGYVFVEHPSIYIDLIILAVRCRLKLSRGLPGFLRNLPEVLHLLFVALD